MTEHKCPRREEGCPAFLLDKNDTWDGVAGQTVRGTCSYCGSMHPDDFMDAARTGAKLGPTDKNYKAYVDKKEGNHTTTLKFYFQHLSVEQRQEFVELINQKKLIIGYPGYFYNLPFFCKRV